MNSQNNSFDWRGTPSMFARDPRFTWNHAAKGKKPAVDQPSRDLTASINTLPPKAKQVYSAE